MEIYNGDIREGAGEASLFSMMVFMVMMMMICLMICDGI